MPGTDLEFHESDRDPAHIMINAVTDAGDALIDHAGVILATLEEAVAIGDKTTAAGLKFVLNPD